MVELLVALGVIGVLIAILLPALASGRRSARGLVCLANLHSTSSCFDTYHKTNRDAFPFVAPGATLLITPPDEGGLLQEDNPWKLTTYWPSNMHDAAPWREYFGTWVCPGSPRVPGQPWKFDGQVGSGLPSYTYCRTFLARPEVWSGDPKPDPALLRAVSLSDVQYPAGKALLFDSEMAHLGAGKAPGLEPRPILFVDGHAAQHRLSEASAPVINPFTGDAFPLHDTRKGARGMDY